MKRYLFSFCCFLAIVIGGCKKSQPLLAPEPPPEKLVTIKQTINNGAPVKFFDEFVYDDEDRLKEIKANNGNGSVINRRYYYSGNQVQYKYYVNGIEQPTMSLDITINSAGYVEESLSLQQGYRLVYEYNNMNFVKKINFLLNGVHNSYSQYYYSSNNRLDSMVYRSNDNMNSYVTTYSYMMDKKNTIGHKNKGLRMFGSDQEVFLQRETMFIYTTPSAPGQRVKYFENEYE